MKKIIENALDRKSTVVYPPVDVETFMSQCSKKVKKGNIVATIASYTPKRHLEQISGLTADQAKELLIRAMENEARHEGARLIKKIENETKETADKKAKNIMATAIQRYASDFVAERTVSVVQLPSDEMKGRIIGRRT